MKRNSFCFGLIFILILFLIGAISVYGQNYNTPKVYNFVKDQDNIILNASALDVFFDKLYRLKTGSNEKVNIVHIGDSHIQADFLTEVVRKNLQTEFGNAGRGLIVPGRLAGTNEPYNLRSSSNVQWKSRRISLADQTLPIGIGGITIASDQPNATLTIRMNDPIYNYSFTSMSLFYLKDELSFNLSILDTAKNEIARVKQSYDSIQPNFVQVKFPRLSDSFTLAVSSVDTLPRRAMIFGINLENENKGVLYHAIGVNSAKYIHYNAAKYFSAQTKFLQPDLFIISLGTNESVEYPYIDKTFYSQIDKLVKSLIETNPTAQIVLVTPPDFFKRKTKYNPGVEIIRNEIIRYAVENGLAFWDMYKVGGGSHSAIIWRANGLLRPDGIHFTKDGYAYQGNLLFDAIMKNYKLYVSNRHQ